MSTSKSSRSKDLYGGALMLITGFWAFYQSVGYHVGTLTSMGPGYFPAVISTILILSGLAIVSASLRSPRSSGSVKRVKLDWRRWICIVLSIASFICVGAFAGLVAGSFCTVFIAAMGDRQNRLLDATLLSLVMTVVSVVVFWWGLRIQFPLFPWS